MPPHYRYFLVRPGTRKQATTGPSITPGPIIPLIAMDQLPDWLEVVGVPRELSVEQTIGLSNLGTVAGPNGEFEIRIPEEFLIMLPEPTPTSPSMTAALVPAPAPTPMPASNSTTTRVEQSPPPNKPPQASKGFKTRTSPPASKPAAGLAASVHAHREQNPLARTERAGPSYMVPSSSVRKSGLGGSTKLPTIGDAATTAYCRHWCNYGNCKWGYNCRYQHVMPSTPEKLAEVGLSDFPVWWGAAMEMAMKSMSGVDMPLGPVGMRIGALGGGGGAGGVGGGLSNGKKQRKMAELRQMMGLMSMGRTAGMGRGYPVTDGPVSLIKPGGSKPEVGVGQDKGKGGGGSVGSIMEQPQGRAAHLRGDELSQPVAVQPSEVEKGQTTPQLQDVKLVDI